MKKIILIVCVLLSPLLSKCQNKRWMYITTSDDRTVMLIDTVRDEIKQDNQPNYYPTNAVSFWVMAYKFEIKNKKKIITKVIEKITADTIKNKYQTASRVVYKNQSVTDSDDSIYDWREIIPGTISEEFIRFAKSVNNFRLKSQLIYNAYINRKYYPRLSEQE